MNLSLPAWVYSNDEFFVLEKDVIFRCAPQLVCHESDIPNPGDYETFTFLNRDAFVIRTSGGSVRAFYNVCRHRAHRLLSGDRGNCGHRIVCPYHAWSYSSEGALTGVPYIEEYEGLSMSDYGLVEIEHEIYFGFIFIRFGSDDRSVADWLAPVSAELSLYQLPQVVSIAERAHHQVRANWKNGADNYIDALHVRVAHPGLNGLLNKSYGITAASDEVFRLEGQVKDVLGKSELARRYHECLPVVPHLPESHQKSWLYFLIWPNLMFNLYPDQVEFMQFLPVDANHSVIRYGTYAVPDDRPAMQEARELNIALNVEVGDEDMALISSVQRGMENDCFGQGPLGRNESGLLGFASKLRQLLPVSTEAEAPPAGRVSAINEVMLHSGTMTGDC